MQGMSLRWKLLKRRHCLKWLKMDLRWLRSPACETLVGLISKLKACLQAGDRYRLPSSKAARVRSSFHRLRVDPDHKVAWANFLSSIHLPVTLQVHSTFTLQLVVDRLLKKLISMRVKDQSQRAGKKQSFNTNTPGTECCVLHEWVHTCETHQEVLEKILE